MSSWSSCLRTVFNTSIPSIMYLLTWPPRDQTHSWNPCHWGGVRNTKDPKQIKRQQQGIISDKKIFWVGIKPIPLSLNESKPNSIPSGFRGPSITKSKIDVLWPFTFPSTPLFTFWDPYSKVLSSHTKGRVVRQFMFRPLSYFF